MLIGLISDTHIPDRAKVLPQKVMEAFSEVELILHAGDLTSPKVIEELETIAPVMAIQYAGAGGCAASGSAISAQPVA